MSAAEILLEMERLEPLELRRIRRKLVALAEKDEEIAACDASALEAARMLDRMEGEDAGC